MKRQVESVDLDLPFVIFHINMRDSNNSDLYKHVFEDVAKMRKDVEYRKQINAYKGQVSSKKRKQYPAVVVGAEYNGAMGIGHHHCNSTQSDFHPSIYNALISNYRALNVLDSVSNNYVGHCAENYAATKVLASLTSPCPLSNIAFTDAFCPRTLKMKDWCSICHSVFD